MAKTPNILVLDAHMRFKQDGWLNKINNLIASEPDTMWCTTCSVLNNRHLSINRPRRRYYGANIALIDRNNAKDRPVRNIIEPKSILKTPIRVSNQVPCI